jgi:hypothetical protein
MQLKLIHTEVEPHPSGGDGRFVTARIVQIEDDFLKIVTPNTGTLNSEAPISVAKLNPASAHVDNTETIVAISHARQSGSWRQKKVRS